jgi:hypothetical protein
LHRFPLQEFTPDRVVVRVGELEFEQDWKSFFFGLERRRTSAMKGVALWFRCEDLSIFFCRVKLDVKNYLKNLRGEGAAEGGGAMGGEGRHKWLGREESVQREEGFNYEFF